MRLLHIGMGARTASRRSVSAPGRRRSRWPGCSRCHGCGASPGAALRKRMNSPPLHSTSRTDSPSPWPPLNSTSSSAQHLEHHGGVAQPVLAVGADAGQRLGFRQVGRHQSGARHSRFFRIADAGLIQQRRAAGGQQHRIQHQRNVDVFQRVGHGGGDRGRCPACRS